MNNIQGPQQLTLYEIGALHNIIARQIVKEGFLHIDDGTHHLLMKTRKIFMAMGGEPRQLEVEYG